MISEDSTPIRNEILEIFGRGVLSYREVRIASYIIQETGKQDWTKPLTKHQIAKNLNMDYSWCCRTINNMIKNKKLLFANNKYQFNDHIDKWENILPYGRKCHMDENAIWTKMPYGRKCHMEASSQAPSDSTEGRGGISHTKKNEIPIDRTGPRVPDVDPYGSRVQTYGNAMTYKEEKHVTYKRNGKKNKFSYGLGEDEFYSMELSFLLEWNVGIRDLGGKMRKSLTKQEKDLLKDQIYANGYEKKDIINGVQAYFKYAKNEEYWDWQYFPKAHTISQFLTKNLLEKFNNKQYIERLEES